VFGSGVVDGVHRSDAVRRGSHYDETSAGHAAPSSPAELVKRDRVVRDQRADVAGCRPVTPFEVS
jgi:hypothetical protein